MTRAGLSLLVYALSDLYRLQLRLFSCEQAYHPLSLEVVSLLGQFAMKMLDIEASHKLIQGEGILLPFATTRI